MSRGRRFVVTVAAFLTTMGTACGGSGGTAARGEGLQVVAGFARLAEVAARVGGDQVDVRDLTPAGAEPHDLELSTDDVDAVEDADVVLELGGDFQPALSRAARRAEVRVQLLRPEERADPHVWLDPVRFADLVAQVGDALADADPPRSAGYRRRAQSFRAELARLHSDYEAGLARCRRRLIVTAHAAFGRLAARYDLEQRAITGVSPEAEPDPRRLAELTDLVRREGVTHVFTEQLVSPRVARALAREAGVEVAVLDPLEGRTSEGYSAVMRQNLRKLRDVLECE
ncbi:MAG: metal ABC transporter substrate-binding protein [Actinomycetota bacterium]|nr:metal ABC transporter substrate-binding protein [Actinomycetota bacterium]